MKLDDKLHKGEGTTEIARMAVENVAWFSVNNFNWPRHNDMFFLKSKFYPNFERYCRFQKIFSVGLLIATTKSSM